MLGFKLNHVSKKGHRNIAVDGATESKTYMGGRIFLVESFLSGFAQTKDIRKHIYSGLTFSWSKSK